MTGWSSWDRPGTSWRSAPTPSSTLASTLTRTRHRDAGSRTDAWRRADQLLRWLQELLGGADLVELDTAAEAVGPGAGGLLCLPWFLGEKSPIHDPNLRGAFIGLHLGHGPAHLHRACLEAVAFGFRHHVDVLRELGLGLGTGRVTNGGSRSTLWKQIIADVVGVPLSPVVDHPGASLGAAVAAGIGVGALPDWNAIHRYVEPRLADRTAPVDTSTRRDTPCTGH